MNNQIQQGILPGITQEDWYLLSLQAAEDKYVKGEWETVSVAEKILVERNAVDQYFCKKNESYTEEIKRIANSFSKMKAGNAVSVVIPSHNEKETLEKTLQNIADSLIQNIGFHDKVEILVVINGDTDDTAKIKVQENIVRNFQNFYPELQLYYVVIQEEKDLCCVGLARMVGHDIEAYRSNERALEERICPLYIQMFDADTEKLSDNFFNTVLSQLKNDEYSVDYYREYAMYPQKDIGIINGLHAMDVMWNDTITELSKITNCGWTLGASTLISLFHYVMIGGVFPFNMNGGAQEDIRIGLSLNEYSSCSPIKRNVLMSKPLLYTNPRRALVGVYEVLNFLSIIKNHIYQIPYDLHLAARLLKYYINFNGQNLFIPYEHLLKSSNLTIEYLEILCNSYRELARDTLLQYELRDYSDETRNMFLEYQKGNICYSEMVNQIKEYIYSINSDEAEVILENTENEATEIMEKVLNKYKISYTLLNTERTGTYVPVKLKITDLSVYKSQFITKISFIIPTFNRKYQLIKAIESIINQSHKCPYEIIICDNGSTDGTDLVKDQFTNNNIRYVRELKKGPACARNAGVRVSEGDWIVFLDDDVTLDRNWINYFYENIKQSDSNIICGKVSPVWPENFILPRWVDGDLLNRLAIYNLGNEVKKSSNIYDIPYAANLAIKKRIFEQMGGFSEKLLVSEDTDFLLRCLDKDYEYFYNPNLIAYHWIPAERLSKKYFYKWSKVQGKYNCHVFNIESLIPIYKYRNQKPFVLLLSALKFILKGFFSLKGYERINYKCIALSDFTAYKYCLSQRNRKMDKKKGV